VWVFVVVFLLSRVAAPIIAPLVVAVLVAAAASGAVRAASSVVSFVVAVHAVVISASLFMPVEEFLSFGISVYPKKCIVYFWYICKFRKLSKSAKKYRRKSAKNLEGNTGDYIGYKRPCTVVRPH
jgi:hypothetical protein